MSVLKKLKEKYDKKGAVADGMPEDSFFVYLDHPIKKIERGKITENLTAGSENYEGYIHIMVEKEKTTLAAVNSAGKPPHTTIIFYKCEENKKWLPELIKYLDSLEG